MATVWGSFLHVFQFIIWRERKEKGGKERVREKKRINYSVKRLFIQTDNYSLELDHLQ